jgi:hypothetical protein
MHRVVRLTTRLAVALMVVACGGGSPSAIPSASQSASPSSAAPTASPETASPSAPASASAASTAFTSTTYGYSLTLPAGWTSIQATAAWDGKGMPFHDVPQADQFVGPATASAWFYGAPTTKPLAGRVEEAIAAQAAEHSDTCPPVPEVNEPIQIGGEAGVLMGWNCGILIDAAITVHNGTAYVFGFRDPAVHAAADPTDRALFLELVGSVEFPG